jgi:hypothetical protein
MWTQLSVAECFTLRPMVQQEGSLLLFVVCLEFPWAATREIIIGERNILCHGNGWDEYVPRNLV